MRRHARQPFEGQMQVTWKDSRGQVKKLQAKCLDLSAEGARLETDVPVPSRTHVTLYSPRHGSLGSASEFTSSLALAGQGRKRCLEEAQSPAPAEP